MAKKSAAAPAEQQFRILRGLSYRTGGVDSKGRPLEGRHEAGAIVGASELPKHGSGQCAPDCTAQGDHDWFLTGAGVDAAVIERYPPPEPPWPGAVSVVEEAGAVSLADDAGAVSLPAEE